MRKQGGHSTLKTLKTLKNLEFDQNVKNNLENLEYEGKIEKITLNTLDLKVKFGCLSALISCSKKFRIFKKMTTIFSIFSDFLILRGSISVKNSIFFRLKTLNFTKKTLKKTLKTLNFNKYSQWPPCFARRPRVHQGNGKSFQN